MGFFFFTKRITDLLRLKVQVHFNHDLDTFYAALEWNHLQQHPDLDSHQLQMLLAAFQYARNLVNFKRTPEVFQELYQRVGTAVNLAMETREPLQFEPWIKRPGFGLTWVMWPAHIVSPGEIGKARKYVATLKQDQEGTLLLRYKVSLGGENHFVPVATLATLYTLSRELTPDERKHFATILAGVNQVFLTRPDLLKPGGDMVIINSVCKDYFLKGHGAN